MSEWEKLETSEEDLATEPALTEEEVEEIVARRRRHRSRAAAPLGFAILLFAVIGVIAAVMTGVRVIRAADHTDEVAQSIFVKLAPVIDQAPAALENTKAERDDLLLAAIRRLTEQDRVRRLREHTTDSVWVTDEYGRYQVPARAVEEAYATLFGAEAPLTHRSVGEGENLASVTTYDPDKGCYFVPSVPTATLYRSILTDVKKNSDTFELTVGFVPTMDLSYDDLGNEITPNEKMAVYRQIYTVTEDGSVLVSITDI